MIFQLEEQVSVTYLLLHCKGHMHFHNKHWSQSLWSVTASVCCPMAVAFCKAYHWQDSILRHKNSDLLRWKSYHYIDHATKARHSLINVIIDELKVFRNVSVQ
jgi:hypothetical protein